MEEKINFGKFIQMKRKEKGLSQKEMADKLFVTESAVSKWERGISYPDISMLLGISEVLSVTEHELLTASDDYRLKETEKNAKSYLKVIKTYSFILYAAYILSLVSCFIVNICLSHNLSWFFIVLFSEMLAFSLLNVPVIIKNHNVPVIVKNHKGLWTIGSFYFSLNLLLAYCCIYVKGDWFFIALFSEMLAFSLLHVPVIVKSHKGLWTIGSFYISLNLLLAYCCFYVKGDWFLTAFLGVTFGLSVVFIPLIFLDSIFPECIRKHNAAISMGIDSVLLILLSLFTAKSWAAIEICLFQLILPWCYLLIIRYMKFNGLFKASICTFLTGVNIFILRPFLNVLIDHKSFNLDPVNFKIWNNEYMNGNITLIVFAVCTFVSMLFVIGGIIKQVIRRKNNI